MTVTVSVAADRVECRTDQPILDAFLRGSVWMPNSCNQGTCGTCKLRVVSGSVDHGRSPETTLTQAEREQGFALACQATPCGDTVVERLDTAPAGTVHALRDLVGTVSAIEDVARDTRRVLVTLDSPLEFSAGQYVELRVPGTDHGRQYSMANTPGESKQLEFHIRRQPGGIATDGWVFGSLSVGERVDMAGPLGDFRLDPEDEGPMILLGGGTGLAPLKSMVRQALTVTPERGIHLYHGVREAVRPVRCGTVSGVGARTPGLPVRAVSERPVVVRAVRLRHRRIRGGLRHVPRLLRVPVRAAGDGRRRRQGVQAPAYGSATDLPGEVHARRVKTAPRCARRGPPSLGVRMPNTS